MALCRGALQAHLMLFFTARIRSICLVCHNGKMFRSGKLRLDLGKIAQDFRLKCQPFQPKELIEDWWVLTSPIPHQLFRVKCETRTECVNVLFDSGFTACPRYTFLAIPFHRGFWSCSILGGKRQAWKAQRKLEWCSSQHLATFPGSHLTNDSIQPAAQNG